MMKPADLVSMATAPAGTTPVAATPAGTLPSVITAAPPVAASAPPEPPASPFPSLAAGYAENAKASFAKVQAALSGADRSADAPVPGADARREFSDPRQVKMPGAGAAPKVTVQTPTPSYMMPIPSGPVR